MAQKMTGALVFDERTDRYDIRFDLNSYYGGFEWIGEYDITADELLSGAGGNNATKTEQAEKLILDLLADGKELASEDIEKAAADAGISARTVRAAKKNLDGRITSKRIGAAWYHALKK